MNTEEALPSLHDLDELLDALEPVRRARLEREAAELHASMEVAVAEQAAEQPAALVLPARRGSLPRARRRRKARITKSV